VLCQEDAVGPLGAKFGLWRDVIRAPALVGLFPGRVDLNFHARHGEI
jgi:hypothetical protein